MKIMRILTLTWVLALGAASVATAQAPPLPDVDGIGPQVGDVVPSFSLTDQKGAVRDLKSLMGPNGLMLVFSRSADW